MRDFFLLFGNDNRVAVAQSESYPGTLNMFLPQQPRIGIKFKNLPRDCLNHDYVAKRRDCCMHSLIFRQIGNKCLLFYSLPCSGIKPLYACTVIYDDNLSE